MGAKTRRIGRAPARIPPKTRMPNRMPPDNGQRMEGAPAGGAPREKASGGAGADVSRQPAPPNARVDDIDVRSAGLAAFVASEVGAPAASVPARARGVSILVASRA